MSVYGRSPRRNGNGPFGTLAPNAPPDPRHDLRGVGGRGRRRRGRGAVGRGRLRRRRCRGVGLRRRTFARPRPDDDDAAAPDDDHDDRPARERATRHVRLRGRHPLRGRAERQAGGRSGERARADRARPRRGRPHGRQPRDRRHRRRDAGAEGVHVPGTAVRRSPRWPAEASTSRPWRTTTAWTTARSGSRTRSPRQASSGFPIIGIGHNATEAYAPYTTMIKGQRIAVIGATQVLDDNLITAWTATDTQGGLASAKEVPAPRRRGASRAHRQRHRRRVPALGRREADVPEPDRSRNWRARWWMPVPTSSSAGTRTGCTARAARRRVRRLRTRQLRVLRQAGPGTETGVLKVTATGRDIDTLRIQPRGDPQRRPAPARRRRGRGRGRSAWNELRGCTGLAP